MMQFYWQRNKASFFVYQLVSHIWWVCLIFRYYVLVRQICSFSTMHFKMVSFRSVQVWNIFWLTLNFQNLFHSLYNLFSWCRDRCCQDICETCQRHMLCKLANPLSKGTLLVIGQIQDGFSTSRNKSSSLVLKPCKSIQKTSEEVLFIKAQQIHFYRGLMMDLDSSLKEAVSIKNYEIRISRSDFTHIHVYLCRVSFLTTLDIYKDYFKGRHMMIQLDAK